MTKIKINVMEALDKFERVFSVFSLLLYMNAVVPLFIIQGASEGDGVDLFAFNYTPLNLLFITNYLITLTLLILRWNKTLVFAINNVLFITLILMAPLSYVWSAMPDRTLSGSIGIMGSTMFGFYVATRFSFREQVRLLAWAFGVAIALSFVFIIALPKYGIMAAVHAGSLRGVWTHKNGMGKFMVLSNAVFLMLLQSNIKPKWYLWLGLLTSLMLTVGSNSTNALVNSLLAIAIILFLNQVFRLENDRFTLVVILLIMFLSGLVITFNDIAGALLGLVGKDPTLTGRTEIWALVIEKIQDRPILGYGFAGFWQGLRGESASIIRALRWPVPNSHNGYLDFILQLGFAGFSLFLVIYWSTLVRVYLLLRQRFCLDYLWPLIVLIYLIQINIAEPSLLAQNDFFWILFTTIVISASVEFKTVFKQRTIAQVYQDKSASGKTATFSS